MVPDFGSCTATHAPDAPSNGRIVAVTEGLQVIYQCNPGYSFPAGSNSLITCDSVLNVWVGTLGPCMAGTSSKHLFA